MSIALTGPIALGITGASGAPYWKRLVEVLLGAGAEVHVTWSSAADIVAQTELDSKVAPLLEQAASKGDGRLRVFARNDFNAPMASGSAPYHSMGIVPCSLGTLGRVAHGVSDDLLSRAADVMLKERRPLVLVFREAPLSLIHLENMATATRSGATILPAAPGFYHKPQGIDDLVDFLVQRICNHLRVPVKLVRPWGGQGA